MADNLTLNLGSGGATLAADDITDGGVANGAKAQRIKIGFGPDNGYTDVDIATGKGLPVQSMGAGVITLQASQVSGVANATTTRTTTTGLDPHNDLDVLINITNAGAATGTLQLFLEDSADGGTTWDDLVSSNTFTFGAALTTQRFKVSGRLATSIVQGSACQQETLAAGNVRYGPWGERIRVREKVSGVAGSPTGVTYTITAVPKR